MSNAINKLTSEEKKKIKDKISKDDIKYGSKDNYYLYCVWYHTFKNFKGTNKDCYDSDVRFSSYGKNTEYTWEVDHIIPISSSIKDNSLSNLRVLNKKNNSILGTIQKSFEDYDKKKTNKNNIKNLVMNNKKFFEKKMYGGSSDNSNNDYYIQRTTDIFGKNIV